MISLSLLEQPDPQPGLVHLLTGGGKGKTTAAIGACVRFSGHGGRVLFCQFLKGRGTGEIEPLKRFGVTVERAKCGEKFISQMSATERGEAALSHCKCLEHAAEAAKNAVYGLIVLDEVVDAINLGLVEAGALISLVNNRAVSVEIVLTGHNPSPEICALADYHTDFIPVRHPYQKGIPARKGIEY